MKLMLVDDNSYIRAAIKKLLTRQMSDVEFVYECANGMEAVKQYRSIQPDWVLMDIQLPGLDGLAATKRILHDNPHAKIIIVTQYNDQLYRDEAKSAGAYDYILKENLHEIPRVLTKPHL